MDVYYLVRALRNTFNHTRPPGRHCLLFTGHLCPPPYASRSLDLPKNPLQAPPGCRAPRACHLSRRVQVTPPLPQHTNAHPHPTSHRVLHHTHALPPLSVTVCLRLVLWEGCISRLPSTCTPILPLRRLPEHLYDACLGGAHATPSFHQHTNSTPGHLPPAHPFGASQGCQPTPLPIAGILELLASTVEAPGGA